MMFSMVEKRFKGDLFAEEYNNLPRGKVITLPPHNPFGNGGINGLESV